MSISNKTKFFTLAIFVILKSTFCKAQEVDYMKLLMSGITIDSMDNFIKNNSKINSISRNQGEIEDGELARYGRWRSFWKDRLTVTKELPKGSPIPYLKALATLTVDQVCQNNGGSTPIPNWKQLGPFEGQIITGTVREHAIGAVFAVATLPSDLNTVYIGTGSGGLWKTTNALSTNPTWANMTDVMGMPSLGFSDIIIDPNNPNIVYAAASNPRSGFGLGVIKSTDAGITWNQTGYFIDPLTQNSEIIKQILFSPTNSNHLFLLTATNLHYSTNGGASWIQTNLNILSSNSKFNNMDFDKNNTNVLYIGGQQVWSLNISGYGLSRIDNIGTIGYPAAPTNHSYFGIDALVAGVNNGCYIYGRSWIYQNNSNPNLFQYISNQPIIKFNSGVWSTINSSTNKNCAIFEVNHLNTNIMYIGHSSNAVMEKSTNGGLSFIPITNYSPGNLYNGVSTHADIRAMKLISASSSGLNDVLLVGDDGGVLLTQTTNFAPNNLVNWKDLNGSGLAITEFHGISNNEWDANIIHGGTQDNGIFTFNHGNWRRKENGDGYDCVNDPSIPNKVFCQFNYPGTMQSNNDGLTWSGYSSSPYCNCSLVFNPINWWSVTKWPHEFDINKNEYIGRRDLYKRPYGSSTWTGTAISNFQNIPASCIPCNPPGTDGVACARTTDIISIAISDLNTDKIYVAFSGEPWRPQCKRMLFKTTDNGANWVDISNQFREDASISDIIIDPANDNRIWVSFKKIYDVGANLPKNRVNYSPDGGVTWQDWSVGMPFFPVNDLIYQKGTQDLIYAATDVGVFYRKAGDMNTSWKCYKGNMPVANVVDLEISYCSGKLRAATVGRGLWEADLVEQSNFADIIINTNTIFNDSKLVKSNIIISSGKTLTISNTGYLNISPGKSIVVKPGAQLIVDGGTLTNNCGQFWKGIEVWGTYNSNNISSQGKVILKNNATISYAEEAVRMWKPGDYNSSGGIISATDSKFINNKRTAEFISYPFSYLNRGIFKNCEFITNNEYPVGAQMPFGYITMWNVNGVEFKGCDFINNNDQFKNKFNGIYSIDASYSCTGYCDPTQPLCSMIKSKFENLKSGIESIGPNGTIEIWDSEFTSNAIGVNLNNAHNSKLIRNNFKIIKTPSAYLGIGISMANSTKYIIENNEFSRIGVLSDPICGLVISNSGGDVPFPVQNNLFSNLTAGTFILGTNSIFNDCPFGLQYYCNEHLSTDYDIYIDGTIQKIQRYNSGPITSSGNKFSTSTFPNMSLNSSCDIDYYYNNSALLEIPTFNGAINLIPVSDINTCASNYPIGNGSTAKFSLISSKNELNKQIMKVGNEFKSLNKLMNGRNNTIQNDNNQSDITKKYNALNISVKSNFLNVLNFINLDSTLTLTEKSDYLSKLFLSDESNESQFNLFLSKTFSGEYLTAEKLLKNFNFVKSNEILELSQLLKSYKTGKLDNGLLLDKKSLENIIKVQKNTKGSYAKSFSNLILDKFSNLKPSELILTKKLENFHKMLYKK